MYVLPKDATTTDVNQAAKGNLYEINHYITYTYIINNFIYTVLDGKSDVMISDEEEVITFSKFLDFLD